MLNPLPAEPLTLGLLFVRLDYRHESIPRDPSKMRTLEGLTTLLLVVRLFALTYQRDYSDYMAHWLVGELTHRVCTSPDHVHGALLYAFCFRFAEKLPPVTASSEWLAAAVLQLSDKLVARCKMTISPEMYNGSIANITTYVGNRLLSSFGNFVLDSARGWSLEYLKDIFNEDLLEGSLSLVSKKDSAWVITFDSERRAVLVSKSLFTNDYDMALPEGVTYLIRGPSGFEELK